MKSTLTFAPVKNSLLKAAAIAVLMSVTAVGVASACGPDDGALVEPYSVESYNTRHVMKTGMTGALVLCTFTDCRVQADVSYETQAGEPITIQGSGPVPVETRFSPKLVTAGAWHAPNVVGEGVPVRAGWFRKLPIKVEKNSTELKEAAKSGRIFARVRVTLKSTEESWSKIRAVRGTWNEYPGPKRVLDEPAVTDTFRVPLKL